VDDADHGPAVVAAQFDVTRHDKTMQAQQSTEVTVHEAALAALPGAVVTLSGIRA
jgi:hypothetical protein